MSRDDRLTLRQMLDTACQIRGLAQGLPRSEFDADIIRHLALLHLIQRLGEAASRLSAGFRSGHPEFPWAEMIGMRNRIVHGFDEVDPESVWRVATEDLEPVVAALERVLEV